MLLPIFPYKQFCLILNSLRQNCDWREIIWDIAIRPVLNSPADNVKAKGAKIKQGKYFPVYSNTIYFHNYGEYSKAVESSWNRYRSNEHQPTLWWFLLLKPSSLVIFQAQSVNFALYTIIWTAVGDTDLLPIQSTH